MSRRRRESLPVSGAIGGMEGEESPERPGMKGSALPMWWPESWSIDDLNDEVYDGEEWPAEEKGGASSMD